MFKKIKWKILRIKSLTITLSCKFQMKANKFKGIYKI